MAQIIEETIEAAKAYATDAKERAYGTHRSNLAHHQREAFFYEMMCEYLYAAFGPYIYGEVEMDEEVTARMEAYIFHCEQKMAAYKVFVEEAMKAERDRLAAFLETKAAYTAA